MNRKAQISIFIILGIVILFILLFLLLLAGNSETETGSTVSQEYFIEQCLENAAEDALESQFHHVMGIPSLQELTQSLERMAVRNFEVCLASSQFSFTSDSPSITVHLYQKKVLFDLFSDIDYLHLGQQTTFDRAQYSKDLNIRHLLFVASSLLEEPFDLLPFRDWELFIQARPTLTSVLYTVKYQDFTMTVVDER